MKRAKKSSAAQAVGRSGRTGCSAVASVYVRMPPYRSDWPTCERNGVRLVPLTKRHERDGFRFYFRMPNNRLSGEG